MRTFRSMMSLALIPALTLALSGCGDSVPLPSAQQAAQHAYSRSHGTFAPVPAAQLRSASRLTSDCNLDAVNGKPVNSQPVPHAGSAVFSGWAADGEAGVVPASVQLVLTGAGNFAILADTGASRPDVAKAMKKPAFGNAGYAVKADLSAVPAGEYGVTLLYSVAGKGLKCVTKSKLSVQ